MKKWVSMIGVVCLFIFFGLSHADKIIQWNEAHNFYGQYVTVKGKIVTTYNSGKACFLNFHPNYKKYFTAVIFRSDFNRFPTNPEDHYYLKEVLVTGKIKEYKGKPEIILKDPSQIKIIEETASNERVPEIVSWKEAHKYYGKIVTVEGRVVATYNSGKSCFLNFHKNWRRYFTAVIFASNFHKFSSAPEDYYRDKMIRVKGLIKEYKGKPEIIVNGPSQISIID